MKNLSITILLLILSMTSYASHAPKLDAQTQKKVIERVREYCGLMQEISGNIENIDKMETMFSICENNNVSVFNDLSASSIKDISDNSMPLQQYMMLLTDKFENKVKTSFSGYKYVKLVIQPSPLKEQDAAKYAFVKVDKLVKAPGFNSKQRLNIIVNTSTMKVSSTISEDYEDPQKIYLEALEKFNEGNYKAAIPLFSKICNLSRYPGRYRAKTMLGWSYTEQKEFQKANDLLRVSSEEDPLGGVILASKILLADDVPAKLINYTEAGQILQKLSDVRDKDIPTMHLIAKSAIIDAFDLHRFKLKIVAFDEKMAESLITDSATTNAFKLRGYFIKAFECMSSKNANKLRAGLEDIRKAVELLPFAGFNKNDYEHWDTQISVIYYNILNAMGKQAESQKIRQSMLEKPYCAGFLGGALIAAKEFQDALAMLHTAATYGDAFASYVISLSYLPMHTPLQEYEKEFIEETKRTKDERVIANWKKFVTFLFSNESQSKKSYEEFLEWNKKAMDLGDINAKEDYAFFEASGELPAIKRNIPHALDLACTTACIGLRSQSFKLYKTREFAAIHEMNALKRPFEQTETVKTLKNLDEQGNGAASYLLYLDYFLLKNDTIQAIKYLERSANANFFDGMNSYADMLITSKYYEEAEKLCEKMAIYPFSYICGKLGDIQIEFRQDYKMAKKYYQLGISEDQDPECSEKLADLYKDGLGVKRNLNLAKIYYNLAISYYLRLGLKGDDEEVKNVRAKIKSLENLETDQVYSVTVKDMIVRLNGVLDISTSEEERIKLSQLLLPEIFASPQAKVKTMDASGKTVVVTENAEDFMLRLATMKTNKKVEGMSFRKSQEKNFKLTELTIRIK